MIGERISPSAIAGTDNWGFVRSEQIQAVHIAEALQYRSRVRLQASNVVGHLPEAMHWRFVRRCGPGILSRCKVIGSKGSQPDRGNFDACEKLSPRHHICVNFLE